MNPENYQPYGEEWKKEIVKLPKTKIVEMYSKAMQHTNIIESGSNSECRHHVEGIINDFESGICDKDETMAAMGDYTLRLMDIFWKSAKAKIKTNPDILNEVY